MLSSKAHSILRMEFLDVKSIENNLSPVQCSIILSNLLPCTVMALHVLCTSREQLFKLAFECYVHRLDKIDGSKKCIAIYLVKFHFAQNN